MTSKDDEMFTEEEINDMLMYKMTENVVHSKLSSAIHSTIIDLKGDIDYCNKQIENLTQDLREMEKHMEKLANIALVVDKSVTSNMADKLYALYGYYKEQKIKDGSKEDKAFRKMLGSHAMYSAFIKFKEYSDKLHQLNAELTGRRTSDEIQRDIDTYVKLRHTLIHQNLPPYGS